MHTPGPWMIEADPCHYDTLSTVVGGESQQRKSRIWRQVHVEVGGFAEVAEQEANARLIAAAPDLFACLTAAVEIIDKWIEPETMGVVRSGDGVLGHYLRDEYLMNFRAALSRALPQGTEEGR